MPFVVVRLAHRHAERQGQNWLYAIQHLRLLFCSTHRTIVRSGGFRYKPMMSLTFSTEPNEFRICLRTPSPPVRRTSTVWF